MKNLLMMLLAGLARRGTADGRTGGNQEETVTPRSTPRRVLRHARPKLCNMARPLTMPTAWPCNPRRFWCRTATGAILLEKNPNAVLPIASTADDRHGRARREARSELKPDDQR